MEKSVRDVLTPEYLECWGKGQSLLLSVVPMLEIGDLEFFKVVSEATSLAAAARELKVSAPAVSQRVGVLERRVGLQLLDRKDHKTRMTSAGLVLAGKGRVVIAAMKSLQSDLEQQRAGYVTPLRVFVPIGPAGWVVSNLALHFMRNNPSTSIQVLRKDSLPGNVFNSDDWDVMVYTKLYNSVRSPNELLDQIKISSCKVWLVASAGYVMKHGAPLTPDDLKFHSCAINQLLTECEDKPQNHQLSIHWHLTNIEGHVSVVTLPTQYATNDPQLLYDWCICDMGIVARNNSEVIQDVMAGRLVHILPDWELPNIDIMAVCRKQSQYSDLAKSFATNLQRGLNGMGSPDMELERGTSFII